jgi:hypothetical protein
VEYGSFLSFLDVLITIFLGLAQGSKRVAWSNIRESTSWYIHENFLLPKYPLNNPTRMSEDALRAYWSHWYKLAQSGQQFGFKRVGLPDETDDGPSKPTTTANSPVEPSDDEEEQPKKQAVMAGSSKHRMPPKPAQTPAECSTSAERLLFLQSLAGDEDKMYRKVLEMLAQRRVSVFPLDIYESSY